MRSSRPLAALVNHALNYKHKKAALKLGRLSYNRSFGVMKTKRRQPLEPLQPLGLQLRQLALLPQGLPQRVRS